MVKLEGGGGGIFGGEEDENDLFMTPSKPPPAAPTASGKEMSQAEKAALRCVHPVPLSAL